MNTAPAKITNAERLRHKCPNCHALPGVPCQDYAGHSTDRPHKVRGPGQLEKHLQERIDRQTARAKATYGPLFQDLADTEVRVPTVDEMKRENRFAVARSFDQFGPDGLALTQQANRGMQWLTVMAMLHEIGRRCGENWYEAIRAAVLEGFGNGIEYVPPRLRKLMTTTEPYVLAYFRVPDPVKLLGCRVVPAMTWAPSEPLMTAEEFDRRFALPDHYRGIRTPTDDLEPDDGGLYERVMDAFEKAVAA
jgi:hypothetical protein